jgi:hypothetical protein
VKKLVLLLFFLISQYSYSQTIKGTVLDANNNPIFANIIVKKLREQDIIYQFTMTNSNGEYSIALKAPLDSIVIRVTSAEHETNERHLYNIQKKEKIITFDFILQTRITKLHP